MKFPAACAFVAALSMSGMASAGPITIVNGTPTQNNGTLISAIGGFRAVAQQFTLAEAADITSFIFSDWVIDGNNTGNAASFAPLTVDWAISTGGFTTTALVSHTNATLTAVGATTTFNSGNIAQTLEKISVSGVWLQAGTYYLELFNNVI